VTSRSLAVWIFGSRTWTIVRALLAGSVVASAPVAALFGGVFRFILSEAFLPSFLWMWLAFATIAGVISLTFGLAWHVLALRSNWRRGRTYLLAGVAAGVALGSAGLIVILSLFVQSGGVLSPLYVALGAASTCLLGAILMGGAMWVAWLLRRPDRDATRSDVAGEFD
jgi:hypothetical protein